MLPLDKLWPKCVALQLTVKPLCRISEHKDELCEWRQLVDEICGSQFGRRLHFITCDLQPWVK